MKVNFNKALSIAIRDNDINLIDKYVTHLRTRFAMNYQQVKDYFKIIANCDADKFEELMAECDNL